MMLDKYAQTGPAVMRLSKSQEEPQSQTEGSVNL